MDHYVPIAAGLAAGLGGHVPENLQVSHPRWYQQKHDKLDFLHASFDPAEEARLADLA